MFMLDGRGGQIGVSVDDLDEQGLKAAAGAPSGVRIEEVDPDSPASKSGLREGDIVVELDGERVRSARQFSRLIQETPEGRSVRLGVVRDGKRQTIDVTPEGRAFAFGGNAWMGPSSSSGWRDLEPRLRELEPQLRESLRDLEPFQREFRYNMPRSTSTSTVCTGCEPARPAWRATEGADAAAGGVFRRQGRRRARVERDRRFARGEGRAQGRRRHHVGQRRPCPRRRRPDRRVAREGTAT